MNIYLALAIIIAIITLFSFLIYKAFKKVEVYEDLLQIYENHLTALSSYIEDARKVIEIVDSKGHFRTDDEVEEFFEALKEIQRELDMFTVNNLYSKNSNNLNEKN